MSAGMRTSSAKERWRQAVQWVTVLQDAEDAELPPNEMRRFCSWAADADNAAAFDQVSRLLRNASALRNRSTHVATDEELEDDSYDPSMSVADWQNRRMRSTHMPATVARRWPFVAAAAAIAAMLLVGALLVFPGARNAIRGREFAGIYETPHGVHQRYVLADGSTVMMGAETRLSVHYEAKRRSIVMERGEALFQVKHSAVRPFIVYAGPGSVTAIGTTFDVRRDDDRVVVTVSEGSVEIQPATSELHHAPASAQADSARWVPAKLARGQRMIYEDDGKATPVEDANPAGEVAWREGRLEFDREPLSSVLQTVNRYSHYKITAEGDTGELLYTGLVLEDRIDGWLQGLTQIFPVLIDHQGNDRVVIRPTH